MPYLESAVLKTKPQIESRWDGTQLGSVDLAIRSASEPIALEGWIPQEIKR